MAKNAQKQQTLTRRDWMRWAATGAVSASVSGWFGELASAASGNPQRKRSCILLWMSGGPSQIDTFDPKPNHENGGEFKPISTSVPGIQICEHLPKLARQMKEMALIRSMMTREGDHSRGTYLMRTGYPPQGPILYPTMGSLYSKELGAGRNSELPDFISIAPNRFLNPAAYGPGFLGPQHAPLVVGDSRRGESYETALRVRNLNRPDDIKLEQADNRLNLLRDLDAEYASERPSSFADSHTTAHQKAVQMMRSQAIEAFQLDKEPAKLRDAYGRNRFGQGCLLARRLVEKGVPFIEVSLNSATDQQALGWDTHRENFPAVKALCEALDAGWATLIEDLNTRGLLETTMIVWMGEFGRTPRINRSAGRDHFPNAWSTVLAGGGIKGGQIVGSTSEDGMAVKDRPVHVSDLLATVCDGLGINGEKQNDSNVGRPIRISDPEANVIEEILT